MVPMSEFSASDKYLRSVKFRHTVLGMRPVSRFEPKLKERNEKSSRILEGISPWRLFEYSQSCVTV
jgi:hypothetical protein